MAENIRLQVNAVSSTSTDYTKPTVEPTLAAYETATNTGQPLYFKWNVGTTAETLDLGTYTTVLSVVIKNNDSTNYALLKHRVQKTSVTYAAFDRDWETDVEFLPSCRRST